MDDKSNAFKDGQRSELRHEVANDANKQRQMSSPRQSVRPAPNNSTPANISVQNITDSDDGHDESRLDYLLLKSKSYDLNPSDQGISAEHSPVPLS
jgi:hypothetical protein